MANEKRLIDANILKANFVVIGNSEDLWHTRAIRKAIDNAPTVDAVEVVHGRWECEHETWGQLQCSNCKKEALLEKSSGDVGKILLYVTSNYCPNCGADMRGKKDA